MDDSAVRISVCFTPAEVRRRDVKGASAIVIDVVRATSCIVEAMANGAAGIVPTESVEEALRVRDAIRDGAQSQGGGPATHDAPLLCGERHGLRIDGFDLGNSPAEFTGEAVAGKRLVMTTTNGTKALVSAEAADRILPASFLNLDAVARAVHNDRSVVIVCAGKAGRFAMDDTVCAGHIVRRILEGRSTPAVLDERAQAAADLASLHEISADMLARTAAGRALVDIGLGADLALCARADKHKIVPMMRDRIITVPAL